MLLSVLSVLLDHVNVLSFYIGLGRFTVLHHVHEMMIHIVLTWLKNGCAPMVFTLTGLESKLEGVNTLYTSHISRFNLILELILNEYQSPPGFLLVLIHTHYRQLLYSACKYPLNHARATYITLIIDG